MRKIILILSTLVACGSGEQKEIVSELEVVTSCTNKTTNVLIIGDSISEGYTPFAKDALRGVYVQHNMIGSTGYTNAQTSGFTLANIEDYLDDCPKWDVVTFGNGLWDIAQTDGDGTPRGGSSSDYAQNIRAIGNRLISSGAVAVFLTMAPVETGDGVCLDYLVRPYNDSAVAALSGTGVVISDFNSWAHRQAKYQKRGDVHYSPEGYKILSQFVVQVIRTELEGLK